MTQLADKKDPQKQNIKRLPKTSASFKYTLDTTRNKRGADL